jgi:hypothetical protein
VSRSRKLRIIVADNNVTRYARQWRQVKLRAAGSTSNPRIITVLARVPSARCPPALVRAVLRSRKDVAEGVSALRTAGAVPFVCQTGCGYRGKAISLES